MARVVGAALLLGLGLLGACSGKTVDGDDDDSSSGGKAAKTPSPVAQCETYANTWCTKVFGCYVQIGRLDPDSLQTNIDECVQVLEDRLPCSEVTATSDDFNTCISQIKGMACSKWDVPQTQIGNVATPASCNSALSFE